MIELDYPPARVRPLSFPATRRQGTHLVPGGVDVAIFAPHATAVRWCAFDVADGGLTERQMALNGPDFGIWHGHIPGIEAGQRYGLRVEGAWDPAAGARFNPAKLLLDPYARAINATPVLRPEIYGHLVDDQLETVDLSQPDPRDSAPYVAHGVVVSTDFDWGASTRPDVAWQDTVIYECHVRGLTKRLTEVPPELRGTYAGLAHPATVRHLRQLGVSAIELLPIHAGFAEPRLTHKGLTNYWNYNTLSFFAPDPRYATAAARAAGPQAVISEVKGMIRLLHEAGLEVILDVVYNHTCEGGEEGPQLSWRGLDNTVYYLHDGGSPAHYADVTGCGNSLDFRRTQVVQMTLDSLRYWAGEFQVDGFRYDLAVTLARDATGFDPQHPLLTAIQTDPLLAGLKHIAEPWDLGPGGWRTGQFPAPFAAWNDRFRDAARGFWLADPGAAAHGRLSAGVQELATRLAGSADIFGNADPMWSRRPISSVNYVTAHDGFTMADLVAYEHKHNDANGERGQDGSNDNRSWNHGIEGPVQPGSAADAVLPLRRRSIRNLMATLLLSAGTPMLTAGDEMGRTQFGNNNAYCQDNVVSWVNWSLSEWRADLLATTEHLVALRAKHPALRPTTFYTGVPDANGRVDLSWYDAGGAPMHEQWHDGHLRALQMLRSGPQTGDRDVLLILNGGLDPIEVTIGGPAQSRYELGWDSAWESPTRHVNGIETAPVGGGEQITLEPLVIRLYVSLDAPMAG